MRHDGTRWDFAVAVSIFAINDHLFAVDDYLIQYLYQQDLYCSLFILLPFFIAVSLSFFVSSLSSLLHFALRQMTSPEDVDERRRVDLRRRSVLLQTPGRNLEDAHVRSLRSRASLPSYSRTWRRRQQDRMTSPEMEKEAQHHQVKNV